MNSISCKMPDMPKKKEPQGRTAAYTLYARISPDLGKAWEQLLAQTRRSIKAELEIMMEKYLEEHGLWKRNPPGK